MALETQWRMSMKGPTGLDHNVLLRRLDRMGLTDDEYDDMDSDIRAMEVAALAAMNEKAD